MKSITLTHAQMILGGALVLAVLSLPLLARANGVPASAGPVGTEPSLVYFSAVFHAIQGPDVGQPYKISVRPQKDTSDKGAGGKRAASAPGSFRAIDPSRLRVDIRNSKGQPFAVCAVRGFESNEVEDAMDMRCESQGLSVFSTEATLLFTPAGTHQPRLRFGTWLAGYSSVPLNVQVNRMSFAPTVVATVPGTPVAIGETASAN